MPRDRQDVAITWPPCPCAPERSRSLPAARSSTRRRPRSAATTAAAVVFSLRWRPSWRSTTREEREKGFYDILFLGELPDGGRVEAVVTGDLDPGYGSTSKMIAESALCLVRDVQGEGGTWTPGALMGPALRKRLQERAGLTFSAR
jgi:short subunit dehydrogenase-like uncharacterized protein